MGGEAHGRLGLALVRVLGPVLLGGGGHKLTRLRIALEQHVEGHRCHLLMSGTLRGHTLARDGIEGVEEGEDVVVAPLAQPPASEHVGARGGDARRPVAESTLEEDDALRNRQPAHLHLVAQHA